jgi:hypothetical protein
MSDSVVAKPAARKRRWPLFLALALALVVLLVALAPTIAGGFVPGLVADAYAERFEGRVEVGSSSLGWFGTQRLERVRLLEPSGVEVARADVQMPGAWELLRGGGKRARGIVVEVDANLVADDAGKTNLDRALAPRPGAPAVSSPSGDEASKATSSGAPWPADLELDATVVLRKLAWSDATTRAAGAPIAIENGRAHVALSPGQPLRFELAAAIAGERPGSIDGHGSLSAPTGGGPLSADAELEAKAVPTALVDALARQGGLLEEALGAEFSLSLKVQAATADGATFSVQLQSPRAVIDCAGRVTPRELVIEGADRLSLNVQCGPLLLERVLGAEATRPYGLQRDGGGRIRVESKSLYLPFSAEGADALAQRATGRVDVDLGDWSVGNGAVRSTLSELDVELELGAPASVASAQLFLQADLDGKPLRFQLVLRDLGAALAAAAGRAHAPVELELQTIPLETAALERLVGILQAGPAPDLRGVFGPTLGLAGKLRAERVHVADPTRLEFGLQTVAQSPLSIVGSAALVASKHGAGYGSAEAQVRADGLRAYAERLLPPDLAPVVELLGPALTLDVSVQGLDATLRDITAKLATGATSVDAALTLGPDRLRVIGEQRIDVQVPQFAWIRAASADAAGFSVHGPILFRATELDVPLGAAAQDLEQLLGTTRGRVHLELGSATYVAAPSAAVAPTPGAATTTANAATQAAASTAVTTPATTNSPTNSTPPIELHALVVDATLLADGARAPLSVDVRGSVGAVGAATRPVRAQVDVNDVGLALAAVRGQDATGLVAKLDVSDLPTAAVEPALGSAGRLQTALGDTLALQLNAELGAAKGGAGNALALSVSASGNARPAPLALRATLSDLPALLAELQKPSNGGRLPLPPKLGATVALTGASVELLEAFAGPDTLRPLIGERLDFDGNVDFERAQPAAPLRARGAFRAGPIAPLAAEFDVTLLELAEADGADTSWLPLRSLDATLSARGITAIASKFAPASAAPYLALLGDELKLAAQLGGAGGEPLPLSVALECGATRLHIAGALGPTRLKLPGAGLVLTLAAPPAAVWDALAAYLPPGTRIETVGPLELRGLELDLPVGGSSLDPFAVLPLSNGDLELRIGGVTYVDASLQASKQRLELSGLRVGIQLRTGKPLVTSLLAALPGTPAGTLDAAVVLKDPQKLAEFATLGVPPLDVDAKLAGLSTAILDAWTGRAGMMPDILGERLDLQLSGRGITQQSGTLQVELSSPLARATLQGNVGEELLFSVEEQRTDLAFALTPLSSKRVVGSLVPMFVQVKPVDAAQRASLVLSKFQLPLDGDLRKLNGSATLDLGSVDFGFLPGLAELFGPALAKSAQRLGPYTLAIKNGVVSYDRLSIDIGGKPLSFSGTCDLARSEFQLTVDVPLKYLGKQVSAVLEQNRDLLSPDLAVPLSISGAWTSPKVGISKDFLNKVLEDAALRGLGGLLKGLGKKK